MAQEKAPDTPTETVDAGTSGTHYGYCNQCHALSPASYEERDGKVLLVKDCEKCGRTETIVSTDPEVWHGKRELDRLESDAGCKLNCRTCPVSHPLATVFVEVTNRCNQNCPICIANIPHMGFKFEPPFKYFEKIFRHLATLEPKPSIKLFGGEPTVREDLPDIINCARGLGLSTSVVTNGIRLEDEEYAKKLLATRAKLVFAFDGRDPEVYRKLRGQANCYEQKLKALENIRKHRKAKIIIMCVVAKGINDHLIGDLFEYCHERRDFVNGLQFIPLTRTWEPGTIEADDAHITAMEDVEKIIAGAMPDGKLEFLPAGLTPAHTISKYLPMPRHTFAGAHPNCESISFLVSDGNKYVSVADFLKGRSLCDVANNIVELDKKLGRRMERIRKGVLGKLGLTYPIGRLLALKALGSALKKSVDMEAIFGKHAGWKLAKVVFGVVIGRKVKNVLRANTRLKNILLVVVLPFEETSTLDSAKLKRCPAAFAYEDPDTREIRTNPVCTWGLCQEEIFRRTMENYPEAAKEPAPPPAEYRSVP